MRYLNKDAIIDKIARETGLGRKEIAKATDFQFLFVAEKIRAGHWDKGVRLPAFGRFAINTKYLKYLRQHVMTPPELQALRAKIMKRDPGNIKIEKDHLLRIINTALALHDRLGGEDVYVRKAELVPKGQTLTG